MTDTTSKTNNPQKTEHTAQANNLDSEGASKKILHKGQDNGDVSDSLNNWRQRYQQSEKELDKLIELCLKNCPRNLLIELLKKRKIISRDWEAKGNKFSMVEK